MEEKENILSEIRTVAPALAGVGKQMPFEVPEDYFDLFPVERLAKVPFPLQKPSVPEGYFDSLPAIMLAKVKELEQGNELEAVAPALVGISRQMPYSVPAGYFENLQARPVQTAPVIPIRPRFNLVKWAVAASVIALAGLFAWQYFWNAPATTNSPELATTAVADSTSNAELAAGLANLEDTSLDTELDDAGMPKDTRSALYYLDTENFETALQDFSDEEIKTQLADQVTIKNKT